MNTLTIFKKTPVLFIHRHNGIPETDFEISDFAVSVDGLDFKIIERDGSTRYKYKVANIAVIDETNVAMRETFTTLIGLVTRLRELEYTPYRNGSTGDFVAAGSGVTITGSGTQSDPKMISVTGGSYTPLKKLFKWTTGDPLTFNIGAGNLASNVFVDRVPMIGLSDTGIPFTAEWSQSGNVVTLSSSVIDAYLFNNSLIYIT